MWRWKGQICRMQTRLDRSDGISFSGDLNWKVGKEFSTYSGEKQHTSEHILGSNSKQCWIHSGDEQFISLEGGIYVTRTACMCSVLSIRSLPSVAFQIVPVLVWLTMALSRPSKEDHLALPLFTLMPHPYSYLMVWRLGSVPAGKIPSFQTPQIFQHTSHSWQLLCLPVSLLSHFPSLTLGQYAQSHRSLQWCMMNIVTTKDIIQHILERNSKPFRRGTTTKYSAPAGKSNKQYSNVPKTASFWVATSQETVVFNTIWTGTTNSTQNDVEKRDSLSTTFLLYSMQNCRISQGAGTACW